MGQDTVASASFDNQLLDRFLAGSLPRLLPHLRLVELRKGEVLYRPGELVKDVYFPRSSLVAITVQAEDARCIGVSAVGRRGLVGLPALLGGQAGVFRAVVAAAGAAWRINAQAFRQELGKCAEAHQVFQSYLGSVLSRLVYSSTCFHYHFAEQRLCRWLLDCADGFRSSEVRLTHESLAELIGSGRSLVTNLIGKLEQRDLIRRERVALTILNRGGLEAAACDCYHQVAGANRKLWGKGEG